MNDLPAQPVKGLIDGLGVLQELTMRRDPASCTELSASLGLEKTRVNRILKTLAHLGLAHQGRTRGYSAGPGMHVLAAQSLFSSGLVRKSIPQLEKLNKYGHIVAMGVLWKDRVSYIYHWAPGMRPSQALGRSSLYPARRSAIGTALLAEKSDDDIKILYRHKDKERRDIMKKVDLARKRGYADIPMGSKRSIACTLGAPAYSAVAFSGNIADGELAGLVNALKKTICNIEEEQ